MPCTLAISAECLASLDQTLNQLRKRSQHRSIEAAATGAELMALRSAAVEVAAGAYVDGSRKRRRQVPAPVRTEMRSPTAIDTSQVGGSSRRGPAEIVVCLLSSELLDDLDEVLGEVLRHGAADDRRPLERSEARDVVVESAIASWLMLRGYAAVVPPGGRVGGWCGAVRLLASLGKRGPK